MINKNYQKVYDVVRKIPQGKTMTYGEIGKIVNINPRTVGKILHLNPDPTNIPCHRVVNVRGEVAKNYAFGGANAQKERLHQEGVKFTKNKIKLDKEKKWTT